METITIKGERVIDIYESFDGSYWFVTDKAWRQDSLIGGRVHEDDQILFGYVRLSACPECAEWGYFSEGELKRLGPRIWKVHRQDWAVCPLVEVADVPEDQADGGGSSARRPSYSNTCKEVIRTERATQGTGPATEKQKQFMKKLNIRFPATVTKHEASALIDEELAKNGE
jgi:hypothetical protein